MWCDVDYAVDEWFGAAEFLSAMSVAYKFGQARVLKLEAVDPAVFDDACRNDLGGELLPILSLFRSRVLLEVLDAQVTEYQNPRVVSVGRHEAEGFITQLILRDTENGGDQYSDAEARSIACNTVEAILTDCLGSAESYRTYEPWCDWFHACGLDFTIIFMSRISRTCILMIGTEAD